MIEAMIIGAGGYGGLGLLDHLLRHPEARVARLVSTSDIGERIDSVYPHLAGFCDLPILGPDDPAVAEPVDVVFMSTPDRVGMGQAARQLAAGAKVVDFSGDFRFQTVAAYEDYARRLGKDPTHEAAELLPEAVYGLPELHRQAIGQARLVGNPGCFAVSCILGLAPAVARGLPRPNSIVCDCKTGVSGAGKKPSPAHHFPARYDNMAAYRLSGHQHVCEVEHQLSAVAKIDVRVTFTAQVVPACRGIMSCLYGDLADGALSATDVVEIYREFYRDEPFVRVYAADAVVGTADVRGSNVCNLVVDVDARTNKLRVVSYIDNLVKGQSGSAVQNMNIMFGLRETAGLDHPGNYP